jgi:hypothetical protein
VVGATDAAGATGAAGLWIPSLSRMELKILMADPFYREADIEEGTRIAIQLLYKNYNTSPLSNSGPAVKLVEIQH